MSSFPSRRVFRGLEVDPLHGLCRWQRGHYASASVAMLMFEVQFSIGHRQSGLLNAPAATTHHRGAFYTHGNGSRLCYR